MKKLTMAIVWIISNIFILNTTGWGWDNKVTHKDLTENAALQSILGSSTGDLLL